MFNLNKKKAKEVKLPNYEVGIRFTFDTTDFAFAIKVIEVAFEIEPSERWSEIKESNDMTALHFYLEEELGYDVSKYRLLTQQGGE